MQKICKKFFFFFLNFFSDDSPGQAEGVRQADAGHAVETPGRADAQGGPAGRRPHQGLYQLVAAPFQEARQQELSEHLPALLHPPSLQYSVLIYTNYS